MKPRPRAGPWFRPSDPRPRDDGLGPARWNLAYAPVLGFDRRIMAHVKVPMCWSLASTNGAAPNLAVLGLVVDVKLPLDDLEQ